MRCSGLREPKIEGLWRSVHPSTTDERFEEILPRHTSRPGFRFLVARTGDGSLAGFVYGYEGGPDEWWHDRVAAAMTAEQREERLGPGDFELVELLVDPDLEGQGIGGRLHHELLASLSWTAVLNTQRSNSRALGFYKRRGWSVVVSEIRFGEGYPPFTVLGKHIG